MNYQLVFRSRYGQIAVWGLLAFSIFFLGTVWWADGFVQMLAAVPFPLGIVYFTWWIWTWPAVIVDERGIAVRNQVRTADVSWSSFARAEARWGLYVYATPTADPAATPSLTDTATPVPHRHRDPRPPQTPRPPSPTEVTAGGRLTIGAVDPINLDPDDLASKKAIYASAVPARGGFKTATSKEAPPTPPLNLGKRNRVVLRVTPMVAARILDEEKFYLENPSKRPESHTAREPLADPGAEYQGLRYRYNFLQIGVFVAFAAFWIWRILF
jgi:hypothetical protein